MVELLRHPLQVAVVTLAELTEIDRFDTDGAKVSAASDSGLCDDRSDPFAESVQQALHAAEGDHPEFFGGGHAVPRPDTFTACSQQPR